MFHSETMKTAQSHNSQLTGQSELVSRPEFDPEITFCAFRYALGRMTYVVGDVVDYLKQNWAWMTPRYQELIHKEILQAIRDNCIGMEMDKVQWVQILDLPIEIQN
jgi:hypothetical protein